MQHCQIWHEITNKADKEASTLLDTNTGVAPFRRRFSLTETDTAISISALSGVLDTTTLAAHDFDVDTRTGFLPPQAPLSRLPAVWEEWEETLENAVLSRLQLGDKPHLQQLEKDKSRGWRDRVRKLPVLPTTDLTKSEVQLRRAHHVLAWIMHFYIHTLPPDDPIRIPPPITIPLLQVSKQLQLPPVLTYSDNVLYNWRLESYDPDELPTIPTLRCLTSFTSTKDEAEFYLVSARIELAGVEALELMGSTMDEMFVGDGLAIRRITSYLGQLVGVIYHLRELLLEVKLVCNPSVFHHDLRPWFRGEDSQTGRKWEFEGLDQDPSLVPPAELSGPSAGQSSLIHALDIFLGVDKSTHSQEVTGHGLIPPADLSVDPQPKQSFLQRMQMYMPRYHRSFLTHISSNPRQLRDFVSKLSSSTTFPGPSTDNDEVTLKGDVAALSTAYNAAVLALKEFRDAHLVIVALYIIIPSRDRRRCDEKDSTHLRGTGGTDLVRFLKEVRDRTKEAAISS